MAGPFSSFLLEVETIWCYCHCNNFACKGHDTQDELWCTQVFFQQHYKYDTMQQPKFASQSIQCDMTLKVNWHWPFGSIDTCTYAYACTYIIQACRACNVHVISILTAKQLHICSTQNVNSFVIKWRDVHFWCIFFFSSTFCCKASCLSSLKKKWIDIDLFNTRCEFICY